VNYNWRNVGSLISRRFACEICYRLSIILKRAINAWQRSSYATSAKIVVHASLHMSKPKRAAQIYSRTSTMGHVCIWVEWSCSKISSGGGDGRTGLWGTCSWYNTGKRCLCKGCRFQPAVAQSAASPSIKRICCATTLAKAFLSANGSRCDPWNRHPRHVGTRSISVSVLCTGYWCTSSWYNIGSRWLCRGCRFQPAVAKSAARPCIKRICWATTLAEAFLSAHGSRCDAWNRHPRHVGTRSINIIVLWTDDHLCSFQSNDGESQQKNGLKCEHFLPVVVIEASIDSFNTFTKMERWRASFLLTRW